MYHVELRQFPHNMCRFNLIDAELRAIVEPWAREQVVEFGERKWSSQTARITILDGPRIPLEQLTMGRGWRAAQRQSEDVTDQVLAAAREALAAAPTAPAPASTQAPWQAPPVAQPAPLADPLALGVLADLRSVASLLGEDPGRLLSAWREVAARSSGLSPSESLALAERQIRS
ncbi:MAG: hypothetical protein ABSB69_09615 [Solirubrobacteraceae bacterium]